MREINPSAAAVLIGFGLLVMAVHKAVGGEPFFFWFAFALAVLGTVSLTPLGRRLW